MTEQQTEKKQFPDYVYRKIEEMVQRIPTLSKDYLLEEFIRIFNDPFVQTDPQFKSDDERYQYSLEVLWVKVASQPPTQEYSVIPFGVTDVRMTSQGPVSRVYALIRKKGEGKEEMGVILFKGHLADMVKDVRCLSAYKSVRLAKLRTGNVYFATSMTKFEGPVTLPIDAYTFFKKHLGVPEIKIAETPYKQSKKVDKYVDEFDLRIITGIVLRYNFGKRAKTFSDWAVYTISDDSVGGSDVITNEGYIIPSQFTVWIPRQFLLYDVDSKLMFVGTVSITEDKEPFMNAIYVHPIYAKPIVR